MSAPARSVPGRLIDRVPRLSGPEMVAQLLPPRQFATAGLDSYRPDPDHPSQAAALAAVRTFVDGNRPARRRLFRRNRAVPTRSGIYLDGGFGVGKTHLLAALWHEVSGPKYFGTFIEYTALVGALGFAKALALLTGANVVCIDEFELDDPGDTRLMSRLLTSLAQTGSRIAATSNTPPNALGEGRFAAQDFLREIDSLAAQFETIRIDGLDYRRRDGAVRASTVPDVSAALRAIAGTTTIDSFDDVVRHLGSVHPSRYVTLVDGLAAIGLTDVHLLDNQTDALRFVGFVDRLYDGQVRIVADGLPLDEVFAPDMLAGGYRKKYLRACSRLVALTNGTD